jgi:hypothetical protein
MNKTTSAFWTWLRRAVLAATLPLLAALSTTWAATIVVNSTADPTSANLDVNIPTLDDAAPLRGTFNAGPGTTRRLGTASNQSLGFNADRNGGNGDIGIHVGTDSRWLTLLPGNQNP